MRRRKLLQTANEDYLLGLNRRDAEDAEKSICRTNPAFFEMTVCLLAVFCLHAFTYCTKRFHAYR